MQDDIEVIVRIIGLYLATTTNDEIAEIDKLIEWLQGLRKELDANQQTATD